MKLNVKNTLAIITVKQFIEQRFEETAPKEPRVYIGRHDTQYNDNDTQHNKK
jgi:hypothetical protein